MPQVEARPNFVVITTLAIHANLDKVPVVKAFERHLSNREVAAIHILTESSITAVKDALPILVHPRVHIRHYKLRPTFQELIDYANRLASNAELTVGLMNADVSFEGETDVVQCGLALHSARQRGHNAVLAISRHDNCNGHFELRLRDRAGMPNVVSSDCWVFRSPVLLPDATFYHMGEMNCDLMLACDFAQSGFTLLNPCIDITLLHHESDFKTDNYYEEQNGKPTALATIGWHSAKRNLVPYRYYGTSWNRLSWMDAGYMPLPLQPLRKRIYVAIDGSLGDALESGIVALAEIIAGQHGRDLVVFGNQINQVNPQIIGKIGQLSRSVYFIQTDSADDVFRSLLGGEQDYHNSLALIRDLGLLTPKLLQEFHAVVLDMRSFRPHGAIDAPAGHQSLQVTAEARYGRKFDDQFRFPERYVNHDGCTLLTSLFKTDAFIVGFVENIASLESYEKLVHCFLFSALSDLEKRVIYDWHKSNSNLVLGWHKKDPGLYECWNIGIRLAPTEFVSNANVDDLRHPSQVNVLTDCLRLHPHVSVAASSVIAFERYTSRIADIDTSNPWYIEDAGEFGMDKLARLELGTNAEWTLVPHNLPHCMPVWRKSVHEKYGYFDESRFGTYADWAFWLTITKRGEKGYLYPKAYSFYYVNLSSHNRRGDELRQFHQEVEREFIPSFFYYHLNAYSIQDFAGTVSKNIHEKVEIASSIGHPRLIDSDPQDVPRKLHLTGLSQSFGEHRNSFNGLIESLLPLHCEEGGIEFIPFIERYFVWGADEGEAASASPRPLQRDWIGMLHVPFDAPKWFEYSVSPESIFQTRLWKESLPYCRGIICLSEDLRRDLAYVYPTIPSLTVKFPTVLNVRKFDWNAYVARPRLIQAGDWLRKLQAIYEINAAGHEKIMLMKPCTADFLRREIEVMGDRRNDSVRVLDFVSNQEYDELLSTSVVVCMMYGTAANNIVTECVARSTPLIVNPLPGAIEYLGPDYPLYAADISEASRLITDRSRIRAAFEYLESNVGLKNELSYESFSSSIARSKFYAELEHVQIRHPLTLGAS